MLNIKLEMHPLQKQGNAHAPGSQQYIDAHKPLCDGLLQQLLAGVRKQQAVQKKAICADRRSPFASIPLL